MVDVLRITIREYHLHLHRCDQGLRLLEPLLTEVTKALAKSTRYNPPGFRRSLNGSPPAQEPAGVGMSPGDRTTGTSKQANDPGQVLQKWFSDLLQPRKGLPEAPADWLELLKEVAGPEAAAKMHEDDTVWGMDVLGCIWQSDNWLQCIVIPALREPEVVARPIHCDDEGGRPRNGGFDVSSPPPPHPSICPTVSVPVVPACPLFCLSGYSRWESDEQKQTGRRRLSGEGSLCLPLWAFLSPT